MTLEDLPSLALQLVTVIVATVIAVAIIRLSRNRLRSRHPLVAALANLVTLVVLFAVVLQNLGIAASPSWFLLPVAVPLAYLAVADDPFATGSLLRALALLSATLGLLSLLRPEMLTAVVALGIAGVMLHLADTARRSGE